MGGTSSAGFLITLAAHGHASLETRAPSRGLFNAFKERRMLIGENYSYGSYKTSRYGRSSRYGYGSYGSDNHK